MSVTVEYVEFRRLANISLLAYNDFRCQAQDHKTSLALAADLVGVSADYVRRVVENATQSTV